MAPRWARHRAAHDVLVRGLDRLGLSLFTPPANRAPTINLIRVPEGVEDARVRSRLLELGAEMGGGLGELAGQVWGVGVMGFNAELATVERFLDRLDRAIGSEG